MTNQVKFYKVNGLTKSGLTVGGIYFDKTTGIIHVATSATTTDEFGVGVKSATLVNNVLEIVNQDGEKFSVDFKDIASASSVVAALNTKLNIGAEADTAGTKSYYGLKKDIAAATNDMATNAGVDAKIAAQAATDKTAWEKAAADAQAAAIAAAKADRAIRSVNFLEGSEYIYIDLSEDVFDGKADAELNVAKDIEQVSATSKELADAYAVKTYVDSQVTSALEWAEFN